MQLVHAQKPAVPRDRLLRLPDVVAMTGASKTTIYDLMKAGKFPSSTKITRRMAVWSEAAVLTWIQARITEGAVQ